MLNQRIPQIFTLSHPFLENASMTLFCRSSDLLPFVLPSHLSLKDSGLVVGRQTSKRWSSQQRDCPGFSPDSLFIRDFAKRKSKRNKTLQIYGFLEKQE